MIEVEGEGAKYWSRWRGPSGQGIVKAGKYTRQVVPDQGVKWKVPVPAAATRRLSSGETTSS